VILGREGGDTLPAKIRKALDVNPGDPLLLSFDLVLKCLTIRPAKAEPRVYSDEHLASLARAFQDEKEGRLVEPTEEYIADLVKEKETDAARTIRPAVGATLARTRKTARKTTRRSTKAGARTAAKSRRRAS
jgi:bifunctional DNA-binding transcriptional regulator/antitoxin component of YhaV-PrlF toxin-antitoxin module